MGNVDNYPVAIITKGNTVTMINMVIAVEDEKKNKLPVEIVTNWCC